MRLNKRVAIYGAVAAALLILIIFLVLPPLIKNLAISKIDEATGRKCQIAAVSLNPFTLTASVSGVKLSERGSDVAFVSLSSARLSLSPLSLPKRSFIISELQISSPYLHVVRNAPNDFNFTDLLQKKKPAGDQEEKGGTPLFSINNITIKNGSLDFKDHGLTPQKAHTLRKVDISIPFITNMPYLADRYVTPHFSAVVNGAPFNFEGRLKPLTKAVEATISVNVKQFDLPFYLGYLPVPPPVEVRSGKLETALELGYRVDEKRGPDFHVSGMAAVDALALHEPAGDPLATLKRGEVRINDLGALSAQYNLASLTLTDPEVFASRDRAGVWNWQRLGSNPTAKRKDEQPAQTKKAPELKLGEFRLTGGRIHLADAVPTGSFRSDLQDIGISVQNLSTVGATGAPFDVKFASARGEKLALKGVFAAAPLDVKGNVTLEKIPLKEYYPYLADTLAAPVIGTLGASAAFTYNAANGFSLDKGFLKGEGVAAPFGTGDGFALKEAVISGISANLKQRTAAVESMALNGGKLAITGEKDGEISAKRLLAQKPVVYATARGAATKPGAAGKDAKPFSYRIGKISASGLDIRYADRRIPEEPVHFMNGLSFSVSGITSGKQAPIPFTLQSGYAKGGRIAASGQVTPAPFQYIGKVDLHRIPLRDLDPYINRDTNVFIADGALDASLTLNLEKGESGLRGSFDGSMGVRSFYCQDMVFEEDLLKWERLQLDHFSGTVSPFALKIGEVSVTNFYSRVVIDKNGRLNLQELKKTEGADGGSGANGTAPPTVVAVAKAEDAGALKAIAVAADGAGVVKSAALSTPAPAGQTEPRPIRIDAITLQGGTLEFSDRRLQSPFDTTFFNLGGRVSGLSSQENRLAEVDLRGNLENHSPLSITGAINPLRGDLYLDLKVAFSDIELSRFTPYSDTFLGYNVDKGKLFLDLYYKIDKKALSSQNKVFVDQFSFGKAVESDKATKLPVRLAVALLKDAKGEIHLDLPVTGRTDDPKFSVWKVVLQMLGNLCSKAATAPFALLGSMFGGNEDFSAVAFTPGSAQLAKAEQEKLLKLSQAVAGRPALNLEISGFVDRERDAEGYRNELLLKKLKGEKFRTLVKQGKSAEGQTQESTEILPEDDKLYLKAVYVKEKFPKPRNALGLLKSLPEEEMRKLIIANTQVGNDELQALARERAEAVKAFLLTEGKVAPERLFEKHADIYQPSSREGIGASRVEFGANVK